MVKTYWKEISDLNDIINNNDPVRICEFIDILAKNKLLTGYMMAALCEATHCNKEIEEAFDLLHEFANKCINDGK